MVDAIVNSANTDLKMGGGVCGAIFTAAGAEKLQAACDVLAPIKTGEAVVTPAFDLPAKYIIHAAGPVYRDGSQHEENALRSCYQNALRLALEHDCQSIAFPLISAGIYGYPKAEALRVARETIRDFLGEHDMDVRLVLFDGEAVKISEALYGEVESFISDNYEVSAELSASRAPRRKRTKARNIADSLTSWVDAKRSLLMNEMSEASFAGPATLEEIVKSASESFSQKLFELIAATGETNAEIARRANLDRRHISKILNDPAYSTSKATVFALAIALKLDIDQTRDLLERAGFAISNSRKDDLIIAYFLHKGIYDIDQINDILYDYGFPCLGTMGSS
ncbi:MAG: macro domain-containing protein [Symbiobacteriaceae bacterium]|nr:macro domain-containing protein [Symbiobacteriaceae bacterium]